jgi:hypothetical protein
MSFPLRLRSHAISSSFVNNIILTYFGIFLAIRLYLSNVLIPENFISCIYTFSSERGGLLLPQTLSTKFSSIALRFKPYFDNVFFFI